LSIRQRAQRTEILSSATSLNQAAEVFQRHMRTLNRLVVLFLVVCGLWQSGQCADVASRNDASASALTLGSADKGLWDAGVGEGFRSSTRTLSFEVAAAKGFAVFGGSREHDLALTSLSYGHMWGHTVGEDHWYRGNWELRLELFGGVEFSPKHEWLMGVTPHLRYNFATGTRFVPFIDAGAGATATSIGPPDLSNVFEFNLQATGGIHYFVRENLAVTLEARFLHMSCAGITSPNRGVNGVLGSIGLTVLF
jgi:lipid A 3-O-deacylase